MFAVRANLVFGTLDEFSECPCMSLCGSLVLPGHDGWRVSSGSEASTVARVKTEDACCELWQPTRRAFHVRFLPSSITTTKLSCSLSTTMSSAAARAEARRKAILSRGSDRLSKLTTSARGEDAPAYAHDGAPFILLTPSLSLYKI